MQTIETRVSKRSLAWALALLSVFGCHRREPPTAREAGATTRLDPATRDLFAWFEGLGLPSVRGARFARIVRSSGVEYGFVIRENRDDFSAILLIDPETVTRTVLPDAEPPRFEPIDLSAFTARYVEREPGAEVAIRGWMPFRSERLEAFLLAVRAHEMGLDADAVRLLAHARRAHEGAVPAHDSRPRPAFDAALRHDLGYVLLSLAISEYASPDTSRDGFRTRLRIVAERIGDPFDHDTAEPFVAPLDELLRQDAEHLRQPPAGRSDHIGDLVFSLRDLHGRPIGQRAGTGVFSDPRGEQSPSNQLRALGHDAVPALLALLGDRRLTRMLAADFEHESLSPDQPCTSGHLLTHGEVAREILSAIAVRRLASDDEARTWWRDVQQFGEFETVSRGLRVGERVGVAERVAHLIALDRARGVSEIIRLARAATGRERAALVGAMTPVRDEPAVIAFLRAEIRGTVVFAQVNAARLLADRGDRSWVAVISSALTSAINTATQESDDLEPLIRILIARGGPEGIGAVDHVLTSLPVQRRIDVLSEVANRAAEGDTAICEALLERAIDDDDIDGGSSHGIGVVDFASARVGDVAALRLGQRVGIAFDPMASPFRRARTANEIRNRWRATHGLQPHLLAEGLEQPQGDPLAASAAPTAVEAIHMASTLRAVLIARGMSAPEPCTSELRRLVGRVPSAAELLDPIARCPGRRRDGLVEVHIVRDVEGRGLTVTLGVRAPTRWTRDLRVTSMQRLGRHYIDGSSGGGFLDPDPSGGRHLSNLPSRANESLQRILAAPGDTDGEALFTIEWNLAPRVTTRGSGRSR